MTITIAVDAMGGDYGPSVTVPASLNCLNQFPDVNIALVGDVAAIQVYLEQIPQKYHTRIQIKEAVEEAESSSSAARGKSNAPISIGIGTLLDKTSDAFVSAGHTASLLASSTFRLKRIPGISRPAICSAIPSEQGLSLLLDVGANLVCSAQNLYEFAVMGSLLTQSIVPGAKPRIAILNVGIEASKGTSEIKGAAQLIDQDDSLNYIGFIEGMDLFSGEADVVVCDGLTGNMALKASEGSALFVTHTISKSIAESKFKQMAASFAATVFKDVKEKLNPQNFNGAIFLGVQGVVVKSHGHADVHGFTRALERAVFMVRGNLIDTIRKNFESPAKNN